ncbi:unnamed protein product [Cladocopium goreaui]|uniref:Uncharacterized protein n=1 Tax=Cladocopium goreaui TaxID=2562237 RepID=A0A9P1FZP1_9DINO|nr:unnamed protein product [Cladocopium goreaui]
MATTLQRLISPKRARSSPPGAKVEQGTRETGHCLAAKHTKELQIFLRLVERDEGGFTDWMGRVRNEWQTKLESLDGQDGEMGPLPEGIPETDDFCVPLNELQRSNVCPLLGQWHGAGKTRCMVSL